MGHSVLHSPGPFRRQENVDGWALCFHLANVLQQSGSEVNENGPSLALHDVVTSQWYKLLLPLQWCVFKEERHPFEDVTSLMSFCTAVVVYASMPMTSASPTAKGMKWLCIQYNNHTCSQWSLGSELSSIAAAVVIACWLCISIMIIHSIWACNKQRNVVWSYLRICLHKAWGTRLNPQNTGHHLLPQSATAFFFGWVEASYCQYFLV